MFDAQVFGCATHRYPEQKRWFPFLTCMEEAKPLMMKAQLQHCADKAGMDAGWISDCAHGPLGDELEADFEKATEALVPAHTFVPWVTVNGVAIWEDVDNIEQYVCAAYGGERPQACFQSRDRAPLARSMTGCPVSL